MLSGVTFETLTDGRLLLMCVKFHAVYCRSTANTQISCCSSPATPHPLCGSRAQAGGGGREPAQPLRLLTDIGAVAGYSVMSPR